MDERSNRESTCGRASDSDPIGNRNKPGNILGEEFYLRLLQARVRLRQIFGRGQYHEDDGVWAFDSLEDAEGVTDRMTALIETEAIRNRASATTITRDSLNELHGVADKIIKGLAMDIGSGEGRRKRCVAMIYGEQKQLFDSVTEWFLTEFDIPWFGGEDWMPRPDSRFGNEWDELVAVCKSREREADVLPDLHGRFATTPNKTNASFPTLSKVKVKILRAHFGDSSALLKIADVMAATDSGDKAVKKYVRELITSGHLERPEGPNSGTAITDLGREYLSQHEPPKDPQKTPK